MTPKPVLATSMLSPAPAGVVPRQALARSGSPPPAPRDPAGWYGKLILLTLLLTILEGAARKWLFPNSTTLRYAAYFSKDMAFILAAAVGAGRVAPRWRKTLAWLVPFSALALLLPTALNIHKTSLVGGVLSFKAYFLLPACAYLATGSLRSQRDVDRVLKLLGIATIGLAILGTVQFRLPETHLLNRYDTGEKGSHVVAQYGHVRATGTFAYISGMGIMTGVGGWAGMCLLLPARTRPQRQFGMVVLAAAAVCGMASMSRSGFLMLTFTVLGGVMLFRGAREVIYVCVVGLIVFRLGAGVTEDGDPGLGGAVLQRFQNDDTVGQRSEYMMTNLRMGLMRHPLGEGLGRGQTGGNYAETGERSWGEGYETELARMAFEVGIVGVIGVLLWRLATLRLMWIHRAQPQDARGRAVVAASLPMFGLLSLNYMAFNHTGSSFGWVIAALALASIQFSSATVHDNGNPGGPATKSQNHRRN